MKFYHLFFINLIIQLSSVRVQGQQLFVVTSVTDCDSGGLVNGKCTLPSVGTITQITSLNDPDLKSINFNGNPVESIGQNAFQGTSLESITFPSSLISIGDEAFLEVTTLTSVTFDASSQAFLEIGARAFKGTSLGSVDLSTTALTGTVYTYYDNNLQQTVPYVDSNGNPFSYPGIRIGAFEDTPLTSVKFPATLKHIQDEAFKNTKLTSIDLSATQLTGIKFYESTIINPDDSNNAGTLYGIDYSAFENTPLTSVKFPSTLTEIGSNVFKNTTLKSIDLSSTQLTYIGESTFEDCSLLTSVKFPSTLTEIYDRAFYRTALTSITFPSSLTSIYEEAFFEITNLTSITLNEGLVSIDDVAFFGSSFQKLTVPSSTNSMHPDAFSFCTKLTDVVFLAPENLTDGLFAESPVKSCTIPTSAKSFGGHKFSTFGFSCDLTSKCDCDFGYGCELTQAGSLLTASKCIPGSYKDVQDRNACTQCPTGKYMKPDIEGSISSSDCIACPSGTFTDTTGSTTCLPPTSGENEDPVSRNIAIAAVVMGSVSFALVVVNLSVNLYNNFPHNNVANKVPTHDKEMEVEVV